MERGLQTAARNQNLAQECVFVRVVKKMLYIYKKKKSSHYIKLKKSILTSNSTFHFLLKIPKLRQPWASQVALQVKNPPANAGDIRESVLVSGSGRSPAGGHGNPLQDSCLKNPMDREIQRAIIHRVTESRT